jgi:hypothetical protein
MGHMDAIPTDPRHPETPSDALTAETPRLGGDLQGSPHLPYSPIRVLYRFSS